MWPITYEERLLDWKRLRQQSNSLELPQQLLKINNWWMTAPIVNRTIVWNDTSNWPTPWQLLNNSGYCELARALGIVYTLMLLDTPLYTNLRIINNGNDNLVLVDDGKYILNWAPGEMLNTHSTPITTVKNTIDSSELESFLQ
jgi:hypothetical protein